MAQLLICRRVLWSFILVVTALFVVGCGAPKKTNSAHIKGSFTIISVTGHFMDFEYQSFSRYTKNGMLIVNWTDSSGYKYEAYLSNAIIEYH